MKRLHLLLSFFVAVLLFFLASCDFSGGVPPGRIRINNQLSGDEFSTLEVSSGGSHYTLKSREWVLLPKGTTTINFQYEGPKDTRRYQVKCPSNIGKGISIKLIDVYMNKLPGGCAVVSSSRG